MVKAGIMVGSHAFYKLPEMFTGFWFRPILSKLLYICLSSLCLVVSYKSYGQEKDSVSIYKKDSVSIYKKIEIKARKHKATGWIYDAMFRDLSPRPVDTNQCVDINKPSDENPFLQYKGAPIRKIVIISLDPFGYSVNDTIDRQISRAERWANGYHMNTRPYVIRNLLLFKKNKALDPLELSESERILRLTPYVNDARIYVRRDMIHAGDSVDVIVVVQDKWSTIIGSNFDVNYPDIKFIERNIFGLGHQFEEGISWSPSDGYVNTNGKYSIFNIRHTFISASVFYSTFKLNQQYGVSLERPFYSPLAKWAGGVMLSTTYGTFEQVTNSQSEEIVKNYALNYNTRDIWAAKSFPFSEKKTASINKRSRSIVVGARYYLIDYFERPSFITVDSNRLNRDRTMYLFNLGFTQRTYYRDRYLYRFGANEDIPEGSSVELVGGTMNRELSSLWYYSGVKLAAGKHFNDIGYLSGELNYGTFYNKTFVGSGVISVGSYYFTELIRVQNWYFRLFNRCQLVHGIDRESYENINLNGRQMYGFSSDVLQSRSKAVLNFEFVMYAPYELAGFRFAPIILCGLAKVGNNLSNISDSRLYQAYAVGLLIRNEHLVVNTFMFSIGIYPYMPGNPDFTVKANPVGSYNIRPRDYQVSKPDIVAYQ